MNINSLRKKSAFSRINKGLQNLVLTAGIAAFSLPFFSSKAQANDITTTTQPSFITTIDSDGDGLTNAYETVIGTNPNNADTDGDGFKDGIEAVNPAWANVFSADNPDPGGVLYNFARTENLTTGNKNAISPIWLLRNKIAYIEAETDFTNGTIYVKNINDLLQSRIALDTGLSAELRELGAGPLGTILYYNMDKDGDGKTEIWKANRVTGNVSRAVPTPLQSLGYSVRNPSVFGDLEIQDGQIVLGSGYWLVAETNNPTPATGQLYGFRLQSTVLPLNPGLGNWDGTTPVKITNISTSWNPAGGPDPNNLSVRIARPKVSRDGDKIMFQRVRTDGKTYMGVYRGLEDILNGVTGPYDFSNPESDLRGDSFIADAANGVAFPGGFNAMGNFANWTQDQVSSVSYSLNAPMNFSQSDFDIMAAPVGDQSIGGRFSVVNPGKVIIPLPGNQITPAVRRAGGIYTAFADDYLADGVPGGNFNLYVSGFTPLIRVVDGMVMDILNNFTDPSGITFSGMTDLDKLDLSNVQPDDNFSRYNLGILAPLNPISEATSVGSAITNRRIFGPRGLMVVSQGSGRVTPTENYNIAKAITTREMPLITVPTDASGRPKDTLSGTPSVGLRVRMPWTIEDLAVGDTGLIDESQINLSLYNPSTGLYESLPAEQIIERNIPGRFIDAKIYHFSDYGLGGPIIEAPSAAKNWELYNNSEGSSTIILEK